MKGYIFLSEISNSRIFIFEKNSLKESVSFEPKWVKKRFTYSWPQIGLIEKYFVKNTTSWLCVIRMFEEFNWLHSDIHNLCCISRVNTGRFICKTEPLSTEFKFRKNSSVILMKKMRLSETTENANRFWPYGIIYAYRSAVG